jgi:hypothetical protein
MKRYNTEKCVMEGRVVSPFTPPTMPRYKNKYKQLNILDYG